jgi:hypothetical protein
MWLTDWDIGWISVGAHGEIASIGTATSVGPSGWSNDNGEPRSRTNCDTLSLHGSLEHNSSREHLDQNVIINLNMGAVVHYLKSQYIQDDAISVYRVYRRTPESIVNSP